MHLLQYELASPAYVHQCLRSFFPHKAASVFSVALSGPLLLTSGGDDAVKVPLASALNVHSVRHSECVALCS